jgi:hypothetical protein
MSLICEWIRGSESRIGPKRACAIIYIERVQRDKTLMVPSTMSILYAYIERLHRLFYN